jgi:hypothetical protein
MNFCAAVNAMPHNSCIYASIRYLFSCGNILKFFFFNYLLKNTGCLVVAQIQLSCKI